MEVFYTNTDSETSYRNSGCFCGLVHKGLNKYLPKEPEALLEVPALPLSHRSLFFLEYDNFAFVWFISVSTTYNIGFAEDPKTQF